MAAHCVRDAEERFESDAFDFISRKKEKVDERYIIIYNIHIASDSCSSQLRRIHSSDRRFADAAE